MLSICLSLSMLGNSSPQGMPAPSPYLSLLHSALPYADGIRAIAKQDEPVGRLISRLEVAEGLVLDKVRRCTLPAARHCWHGLGQALGSGRVQHAAIAVPDACTVCVWCARRRRCRGSRTGRLAQGGGEATRTSGIA